MIKLVLILVVALTIPAVHAAYIEPGSFMDMIKYVVNYIANFFSNPESGFSESALNSQAARGGLPLVHIEHRSFFSQALGKQKNYTVLLPPSYGSKSYPVYYLLHGAWGDERTWATRGNIVRIYQEMLEGERREASVGSGLGEMIIAMPDGDNSVWEHACGIMACGDYDRYFLEFVREIESNYKTTGERGIGGLSFGGRGSMRLAFMHPELFRFVGGHSGYYYYLIQDMNGETWKRLSESGMTIYFDNSKNDPLTEYSQSGMLLNKTLSEKGVPHEYREMDYPAAESHAWPYWRQQIRVALEKACKIIC